MTIDKNLTLIVYALTGLLLGLMPTLAGLQPSWFGQLASRLERRRVVALTALVLLVACFWFSHGADSVNIFCVIALVALLCAISAGRFDSMLFVVAYAALFTTRTLPWWRQYEGPLFITDTEAIEIGAILIVTVGLLNWERFAGGAGESAVSRGSRGRRWLYLVFCALAALISFCTLPMQTPVGIYTAWHHWSAYLAPVQLLRAGATPFVDFPIQYGLGPTLIIDGLCHRNCWEVMPGLTSVGVLVFVALLGLRALMVLGRGRSLAYVALALLVMLVGCFGWIGYPPVPSQVGLRFAPVFLQVVVLMVLDTRIRQPRFRLLGHALWALGLLWAPESGFYCTFVWGPYLLWQLARTGRRTSVPQALRVLLELVLVLTLTIALFLAVFVACYRTLPSAYAYFAYILNEPAPLNMQVRGLVWVLLSMVILTGVALADAVSKRPDSIALRRLFLSFAVAFAATSIYIGRSHESNFLSVLPNYLVALYAVLEATDFIAIVRGAQIFIAASLAYVPLLGIQDWQGGLEVAKDKGISAFFDQTDVLRGMSYTTDEGEAVLNLHQPEWLAKKSRIADVRRAVETITTSYHEPVTVYDFNLVMTSGAAGEAWNAIQNTANLAPIVDDGRRRAFIAATAKHLQRPGWFVVYGGFVLTPLLDDMQAGYVAERRLEFGTYYAVRLVPRSASAPARP